jgi:hypothetical protein
MILMESGIMNEFKIGKVAGLILTVMPLAMVGSILLLLLLSGIEIGILHSTVGAAIAGSLLAVLLHWVSALAHHLGHAWAARQMGYPMIGIRFGTLGVLATSVYPPDEPALPAKIHIQRALGGPLGSLLFSIVALVITLVFWIINDALGWVGTFFFLDNLLVFTLGVFVPLGFTDGSILLQWWNKQ